MTKYTLNTHANIFAPNLHKVVPITTTQSASHPLTSHPLASHTSVGFRPPGLQYHNSRYHNHGIQPQQQQQQSQSDGLSDRHHRLHQDGRTLVDDSLISEGNLKSIIPTLLEWCQESTRQHGGYIQYLRQISLEDLKRTRADPHYIIGSPDNEPAAGDIDSRVSIKPDTGIIVWIYNGIQYPLFVGEDKVQGTNDTLFQAGKSKQATGNAVERYFKNIRAEEMLCAHVSYFPSVGFMAGCDFHHSETISKRLEAGNFGVPAHYVEITPENHADSIETRTQMQNVINSINISKQSMGIYMPFTSIPTICIKAHKWNEMKHKSSLWKPKEYLEICKCVVDLAIQEVLVHTDYEETP